MSAWIVNRDHLDLLLTAALEWDLVTREHADATGRLLWKENLASVAHRYPAHRDGRRPGPDGFRDRDGRHLPVPPVPRPGRPRGRRHGRGLADLPVV